MGVFPPFYKLEDLYNKLHHLDNQLVVDKINIYREIVPIDKNLQIKIYNYLQSLIDRDLFTDSSS